MHGSETSTLVCPGASARVCQCATNDVSAFGR